MKHNDLKNLHVFAIFLSYDLYVLDVLRGRGWATGDGPTGIPDGGKGQKRSEQDIATVSASDVSSGNAKASSSSFSGIDLPTPPGASSGTSIFQMTALYAGL